MYLQKLTVIVLTIISLVNGGTNDWFSNSIFHGWGNPVSQPLVSNPTVRIRDGALRGFTMKTATSMTVEAFQGIPFAQPPLEELRFREPRRNRPWIGTRDAIAQSPQCFQYDLLRGNEVHGQEDCLYLNVYRRQRSVTVNRVFQRPLPVMVWIHGGGFFFGAASIYGPTYLLDRDVILVTINHRLGAFGFLSTGDDASPGNQGMKDQVMALRWIQENIAEFGGDPNSVTLFGQSSGGVSVQLHMLSPLSRGLFHRGISGSGTSFCYWGITENATETASAIGRLLNCPGPSHEMVNCLRNVDARTLAGIQQRLTQWNLFPIVHFGPVVEHNHPGAFMTETPEDAYRNNRAQKLPWITGFTKDEMVFLTVGLLLDPNVTTAINNEWDRVMPLILDLTSSPEVNIENVRRIRARYMTTNGQLSFDTRHEFARLFSDRFLFECGLQAMRYHSRYTGAPTYSYRLSYEGQHSILEGFGQNTSDWGVSHFDDVLYLLNNTDYYPTIQTSEPDFDMTRVMITTWTNFAIYGVPLLEDEVGRLVDTWKPIPQSTSDFSPVQLLDLNLNSRMIDDPYVERYNFWRNLNLPD